jgi:hypothetical protein
VLLPLLMNLGMLGTASTTEPSRGGGGNRRRRKIVRLSDYANQDEFREAMKEVIVLPARKVETSDDDDALLAVLLRTIH